MTIMKAGWIPPEMEASESNWRYSLKKGWVPPGDPNPKSKEPLVQLPAGWDPRKRDAPFQIVMSPPGSPPPPGGLTYTPATGEITGPQMPGQPPIAEANWSIVPVPTPGNGAVAPAPPPPMMGAGPMGVPAPMGGAMPGMGGPPAPQPGGAPPPGAPPPMPPAPVSSPGPQAGGVPGGPPMVPALPAPTGLPVGGGQDEGPAPAAGSAEFQSPLAQYAQQVMGALLGKRNVAPPIPPPAPAAPPSPRGAGPMPQLPLRPPPIPGPTPTMPSAPPMPTGPMPGNPGPPPMPQPGPQMGPAPGMQPPPLRPNRPALPGPGVTPSTAPAQMVGGGQDVGRGQAHAARGGEDPGLNQFEVGLPRSVAESICGPTAAAWFVSRFGRNPTVADALELAKTEGWTQQAGMAGPQSTVRLLNRLGVGAEMTPTVDWNRVANEVTAGKPVIVDTPGHYYQVTDYDPQSGAFNFGGSALALRASGGRSWYRPEQLESLGFGAPRAAIFATAEAGEPTRGGQSAGASSSAPARGPSLGGVPENVRGLIMSAADQAGVDPALLAALVRQESGFRPTAGSPAGAYGYTQLMPGTARALGVDINDPAQNMLGGARYLRQQLDTFGGDIPKALAAYNAGPGAVQKYGGVPPFKETQAYVPLVMGFYKEYGGGQSGAATRGAPADDGEPLPEMTPQKMLDITRPKPLPDITPASTPQRVQDLQQDPDQLLVVNPEIGYPGDETRPSYAPRRQPLPPTQEEEPWQDPFARVQQQRVGMGQDVSRNTGLVDTGRAALVVVLERTGMTHDAAVRAAATAIPDQDSHGNLRGFVLMDGTRVATAALAQEVEAQGRPEQAQALIASAETATAPPRGAMPGLQQPGQTAQPLTPPPPAREAPQAPPPPAPAQEPAAPSEAPAAPTETPAWQARGYPNEAQYNQAQAYRRLVLPSMNSDEQERFTALLDVQPAADEYETLQSEYKRVQDAQQRMAQIQAQHAPVRDAESLARVQGQIQQETQRVHDERQIEWNEKELAARGEQQLAGIAATGEQTRTTAAAEEGLRRGRPGGAVEGAVISRSTGGVPTDQGYGLMQPPAPYTNAAGERFIPQPDPNDPTHQTLIYPIAPGTEAPPERGTTTLGGPQQSFQSVYDPRTNIMIPERTQQVYPVESHYATTPGGSVTAINPITNEATQVIQEQPTAHMLGNRSFYWSQPPRIVSQPRVETQPAQYAERTVTPEARVVTPEPVPVYAPSFSSGEQGEPVRYEQPEAYTEQPESYQEQYQTAPAQYAAPTPSSDTGAPPEVQQLPPDPIEQARLDLDKERVQIEHERVAGEREDRASAAAARERPYQQMTKAEEAQIAERQQEEQNRYTRMTPTEMRSAQLNEMQIRRPQTVNLEHGGVGGVDPYGGGFTLLRGEQPYTSGGNLIQPAAWGNSMGAYGTGLSSRGWEPPPLQSVLGGQGGGYGQGGQGWGSQSGYGQSSFGSGFGGWTPPQQAFNQRQQWPMGGGGMDQGWGQGNQSVGMGMW